LPLGTLHIVAAFAKEKTQIMLDQCTKCGSNRIIPLVGVIDQGEYSDGSLKAFVGYTNPEAWVFKGSVYARLRASICGQCGYTELSAENPSALYDAYIAARSAT
jgi:ribosomal protein S27AE